MGKKSSGGKIDPAWALDGVDLMPYLTGAAKGRPHQTLYWRIDGMWAVRDGDWKLVAPAGGEWELYDIASDRTELRNLATNYPARVSSLAAQWEEWARRTHVYPRPR